ncbi:ABC transporter ATP-binding protein [Stappia indica]|uniref:ATP-binding cassette domain-containing protein n=1 Tax=Stappia indica TaxID=538381 RepID=A0A857CDM6_9HYPH|nr:ABC transporter ATP-binding protein [Stappia indica]QGZ36948.1 ATP-binding cassette domain-containing protein [Stappia indica]
MRLATRALATGYRGHPVGRDITLAAGPGEVLCLLGPNGSGKTTLFKTLLGLIPSQGGEVLLDGTPLARLPRAEIARKVAYVPQAHAIPFAFPAEEVVLMGRTARLGTFAQPGPRDRQAAHAALARLGIGALSGRDYTRLSGGQRQLVLIARALAQETPLLVMDEPTASLDFGNQAKVLAEIAGLAADGLTVILSTHDPDHAFAVGTQVALLHGGNVLAAGPPEATLTPQALSTVYGIEVTVERTASGRAVCLPRLAGQRAGPGA